MCYNVEQGRLAELVDAIDSKSVGSNTVWVQVPHCPPHHMRIAIFTDCYLDLTGGIVTNINIEKSELELRGHEVYIFSSAYPRTAKEKAALAKQYIFPVPSCKIFGRGAAPIARRPGIIEKWLLKNHPEIRDFDVFYVHYEAGCSIAGLRLARQLNIPSVQFMHGREDSAEELLIPFGLRTFVATMLNWFHSWYLPHPVHVHRDDYLATTVARAKMWSLMVNHANFADIVITPSKQFTKKLSYYGVGRPRVSLHHGMSGEFLNSKAKSKSLKSGETLEMIWHSRVSGEKRTLPFLGALNILHHYYNKDNYHLSVFGSGPDIIAAKNYAKLHRLHVTFYGRTSFNEIWQKLQTSHLDILASYNYDTFGMVLIEAAAAKVPALIVDPDLAEILPDDSYAMPVSPAPALMAERLAEVLDHPGQIAAMSKNLAKLPEDLNVARKIDSLEQIFASLTE